MENESPSSDQWRTLYDLAARLYSLAPWEIMQETDLVGITDLISGETNYISVMGALGEHLAISLYLGQAGLFGFLELASTAELQAEVLLETPQLQLSFEDREELGPDDRAIIKRLGLKFRGRQTWPLFVSMRPGHFPWRLDASEARVLATALAQLLEVAPRFEDNGAARQGHKRTEILVREPAGEGNVLQWHDVTRKLPTLKAQEIRVEVPEAIMNGVRALQETMPRLEVGLEVVSSIGERGARPRSAYCLLAVEPGSGFVLGQDVFSIETTIEAMYGGIPRRLLTLLQGAGARPLVVDVASNRLASVLRPVLAPLKCEVRLRPRLPQCDRAMESLRLFLSR